MARGRPSRRSDVGSAASAASSSAVATRSNSASALEKPLAAAASRPRRSLRSSLLTIDDSAGPTPTASEPASGYSTPATSNVPTPGGPSLSPNHLPNSTALPKLGASFEIQLPRRTMEDEEALLDREMRNSVYSLNSKRKYQEVGDSEDEDDYPSDDSPDAVLARRLQAEEYKQVASPSQPKLTLRGARQHQAGPSAASTSRGLSRLSGGAGAPSLLSSIRPGMFRNGSEHDVEDEDDNDDDDDDEPLSRGRRMPLRNASKPTAVKASRTQSRISRASSASNRAKKVVVVEDSDESDSSEPMVKSRTNLRGRSTRTASSASRLKQTQRPSAARVEDVDDGENEEAEPLEVPGEADSSELESLADDWDEESAVLTGADSDSSTNVDDDAQGTGASGAVRSIARQRRAYRASRASKGRLEKERDRLERHHPELTTMWEDLEKRPVLKAAKAPQPTSISRQLKGFQLEGLAWMIEMEKTDWMGGLLGDEMGLGKTIQAVSLIMSDFPAKKPSLVLVPPVALMQWVSEIDSYTDGTLKTFVFHGSNTKSKTITSKELRHYDVIMMSYNSLESMYRKETKGWKKGQNMVKQESIIHAIDFHRVILDEAHSIKTRTTMTAKACFALNTTYRWCLTGTPLQNRIGEFFSLIRFLNIRPFASYLCKMCTCSQLEWAMNEDNRCTHCNHGGMQHVSVFNQELLTPIQKYGNFGPGAAAFKKLRLMTDRIMLRRLKKDHTNAMELPVKEIYVDRQFFGEEENDFAASIMTNGQRKFDTYVAQGVLLNNYANIFGLIMQMRQVADHPDLLLKKNAEGGQNILVCCICDEPAEDTIRSRCKHDFCRTCARSYLRSSDEPDCPSCHIPLNIDLEQPEIEQDFSLIKKSSIINRIKMENWTSSSKIELLVHELHKLRSDNSSHKSIIFSQFTTMLQLIEWRLRRAGITTVMLDGSMTPPQRQASINHFMNNVDVECFLVSLKAGGVALNLTEASRVFIVDPWWNPAAEWQSADRCHRIGQTRPCIITRLCIEDSVESRMVLIQEKKTNMINSTVNADDKAMESLSPEDMQFLFRGT